jgi:NADH:ubiquinone reductase (H+-translocating)
MNNPVAKSDQVPSTGNTDSSLPILAIVGGGFGGLAAARRLQAMPIRIILIDRANHNLFQPLLYQVATSVLSPGQIASPIRNLLRHQKNVKVILGEVKGVDRVNRTVTFDTPDRPGVVIGFHYLILATGATQSYFGHPEFELNAPGLKTLADAIRVRDRLLKTFEMAEAEEDPSKHPDLLTIVLIGAGPTGVEMAGAIAILTQKTLKSEFRRIDISDIRIVLLDAAPRVLPNFSEKLSNAALVRLKRLGVDVRLGHGVESIDAEGVIVGGERIRSHTVIWTAGVAASPAGQWLNAETDRSGRVRILPNLTVPGSPDIFVIGDTASLDQEGKPLPGVAQVALQQGRFAADCICARISGGGNPTEFHYHDKGSLAVVGKGFAILQSGGVAISGFVAWLIWAGIHLQFLAQASLRISVFLQWVWTYVTGQRGSRIIIGPFEGPLPAKPAARSALNSSGP